MKLQNTQESNIFKKITIGQDWRENYYKLRDKLESDKKKKKINKLEPFNSTHQLTIDQNVYLIISKCLSKKYYN